MEVSSLKRTSLYQQHVELGANMVPFAGWEMPVHYGSITAEAKAVRNACGMFDVSHMARLSLRGSGTLEFLEWVTSNDVSKLKEDCGQYSLLPNEAGGVVDDIIVFYAGGDRFTMVVNASNADKVHAWFAKQNRFGVDIVDRTMETFMIAVQGPSAAQTVANLTDDPQAVMDVPPFGAYSTHLGTVPVHLSRTGYTGEDGFEAVGDAADSKAVWQMLSEAGVTPCGLAARDALRVEAGLPLYGHELEEDINPIEAGLGWVVSKTKTFIGSGPINSMREMGAPRKLVGVKLGVKRLISQGAAVSVDGRAVGTVTSGVIAPSLDCAIAFAFVDANIALNTTCTVDLRGKEEPGTIVSKRFLKRA